MDKWTEEIALAPDVNAVGINFWIWKQPTSFLKSLRLLLVVMVTHRENYSLTLVLKSA